MSQRPAKTSARLCELGHGAEWAQALAELRSGAPLDEDFYKPRQGLTNHSPVIPTRALIAACAHPWDEGQAEEIQSARDFFEALLERDPSLANARADNGAPMLSIAARARNLGVCEMLLRRGADPNAPSMYGASLLEELGVEKADIAAALLGAGADPEPYLKARPNDASPVGVVTRAWAQKRELERELPPARRAPRGSVL